ncbi:MAG: chromosomal replication initiator protein DnaA [Anaerolineales bacterium]
MNAAQAWQVVLGQLQMDMPKASYETWVRDAVLVSYEDGLFVIGVRNAYARDWLEDRMTGNVKRLLGEAMERTIQVRFVVWQKHEEHEEPEEVAAPERVPAAAESSSSNNNTLNKRYTFHNFVVGASNRLPHAACMAVAENPARAYNPLFLYGGVGLGKTHLLHAIGNEVVRRGLTVLYVSSEEFTNDLIHAIRTQSTPAFREKYRRTDVLLIDDIQFIAGKESTQEEFFHTFNTLHGQDKQIVMSSDRPPKAMVTLEERLRSRFEWGLAADIQPPDFETRVAILRHKAERSGHNLADDILELIARRVQSNIRELEGALTRVAAYALLRGETVSPALVESALADLLPRRSELEPRHILQAVADSFGIAIDRIFSRDRSKQVAISRQIAMYLLREEANLSLPQIGDLLGGRDHTTVMYGCEKVADMLERDDRLRRQVVDIREQLYGEPGFAG